MLNGIDDKSEKLTNDMAKDSKLDIHTSCATSEGVMFSVLVCVAYTGKPGWSDDYYLGYDSEISCPDMNW